jgi:DNA-directed RNA polymerase specialized sigma24 family protein
MAAAIPDRGEFVAFAREIEPRLRYALVAACGRERGLEATVDALEWAWEHWDKITNAANPGGYLYRVATRRTFRIRRRSVPLRFDPPVADDKPWIEPGLPVALQRLSRMQRVAVVLVEGFGLTHQETADLLGVGKSTVQKHLERGMARLRRELGVSIDA